MQTPDLFSAFVNDGVLVGVDVVGKGAGRGGPKVWEKLVLGIERDNREGEFLKGRSCRGGQGDDSDGGFNNGGQEIFDRDVRKWDTVNDFLELKVDVHILGFVGGGVLKLRA